MMEIAFGIGTLAAWLVGLWLHPRCMEDMADLCEDVFISSDRTHRRDLRNLMILDEAEAEYYYPSTEVNQEMTTEDGLPQQPVSTRNSLIISNASTQDHSIITAKFIELGDSPLLRGQQIIPKATKVINLS